MLGSKTLDELVLYIRSKDAVSLEEPDMVFLEGRILGVSFRHIDLHDMRNIDLPPDQWDKLRELLQNPAGLGKAAVSDWKKILGIGTDSPARSRQGKRPFLPLCFDWDPATKKMEFFAGIQTAT